MTRYERAVQLSDLGLGSRAIACEMQITQDHARRLVLHGKRRSAGLRPETGEPYTPKTQPPWREETHLARCKCGLLLPCQQCIPSIWQVATSRSGDASGLT